MKTILTLILAAALAASCKSGMQSETEPAFRTLVRGYDSGLRASGLRIARTKDEFTALWNEHVSNKLPRANAPAVDWSREMVVCVALGSRPTGGYGVEITDTRVADEKLIVTAHESRPASDAIVPMFVSQPYHMVATARHEGDAQLAID